MTDHIGEIVKVLGDASEGTADPGRAEEIS